MSQFIEMFKDAPKVKLGQFISQVRGVSYKPSDLGSSLSSIHRILLRANNISDGSINYDNVQYVLNEKVSSDQILKAGDFLMCTSSGSLDHVGKCAICDDSAEGKTFGAFCKVLRVNNDLNKNFLAAFFRTNQYRIYIKEIARGSNINNLRNEHLNNIEIPTAPLALQEQFAAIYEQADKSEFDGLKSQFIEMFAGKYSTVPLKEMLSVTFPGEWGSDDESGDGVKVIRTTNFTNEGKLDLSNLVTRAIEQKKVDKKKLVKGDIILERSGGTNENPVGRVVRFDEDGTYLFNNFTQLLRPSEGVNSIFLFYSLFSYYQMNKTKIRSMGAKTTGIQNLKMDSYLAIPVCNAPIGVQEQFAAIYEQADKSEYYN